MKYLDGINDLVCIKFSSVLVPKVAVDQLYICHTIWISTTNEESQDSSIRTFYSFVQICHSLKTFWNDDYFKCIRDLRINDHQNTCLSDFEIPVLFRAHVQIVCQENACDLYRISGWQRQESVNSIPYVLYVYGHDDNGKLCASLIAPMTSARWFFLMSKVELEVRLWTVDRIDSTRRGSFVISISWCLITYKTCEDIFVDEQIILWIIMLMLWILHNLQCIASDATRNEMNRRKLWQIEMYSETK